MTNWMRWSLAIVGLLAVLGVTGAARAQGEAEQGEAERSALARALFQEGVELARTEQYEQAADRFGRAYEIRPAPAIAFNLASALAHLDRLVEASERLQQLLRAPELAPELRTAAELQLEQLTPRIGRLTVRASGDLDGVRVQLDERELPAAAIGVGMPIDPGEHAAVALRDGEEVARAEVVVEDGASAELTLVIPERAATTPVRVEVDPAALRDEPPRGDDSGLWIGLGVGIAAVLIAGAVITAVVLAQPGAPDAIPGNTSPAVLEW